MSLGFLIVMLLCAGISFSLAVIDPAAVHLLSWAGAAYIVWLAWKIATSPTKEDGLQAKPISFWASFAFAERQNHFVRCYGTVDVCSAANTGAKLGSWRQRFAGDDWDVWQCVLGAGGHLFQRLFRQYGRQLNIVLALLLVYCAVRIFY